MRSSDIRAAIATGDLSAARALLGRRVAVTGEIAVQPGGHREAELRFSVPVALPPPGRYAATVEPAIEPGGSAGRPHAALVVVSHGETLRVRARADALAGDRVRVAFVRPL